MVQRVLSKIDDDRLDVFVVWIPAIRGDSYEASLRSRSLVPDKRARHYWDGNRELGFALSPVLNTQMQMAWDVYLGYEGDAEWESGPILPKDWLHQKPSEEPERLLDEAKLEAMLRELLAK